MRAKQKMGHDGQHPAFFRWLFATPDEVAAWITSFVVLVFHELDAPNPDLFGCTSVCHWGSSVPANGHACSLGESVLLCPS